MVRGDAAAWQTFWEAIHPTVWAITSRPTITGPLARRDDDRRNIALLVMDRLRADEFRRLRLFLEAARARGASSSFRSWLATVTARAAIDYVRSHPEFADTRGKDGGERWVRIVAISESHAPVAQADPERIALAALVLERARAMLRSDQLSALLLWLQGEEHRDIAARMELDDEHEAERLVRSALKRLRDRLREDPVAVLRAGKETE